MHLLIHSKDQFIIQSRQSTHPPLHNRMRPPRCTRPPPPLRSSRSSHRRQHTPHKGLRTRNHQTRPPDLTHRARHEIALYHLDRHPMRLQLASQRRRPFLQERLAAAICRQQWRRHQTPERTHCEYQPAFLLHHPGRHDGGCEEGGETIDIDDVSHLLFLRLNEGNGDIVAFAHVVDQDGYIL